MSRFKLFCLSALVFLLAVPISPQLYAEGIKSWPRDVTVSAGSISIYQPQVESLDGKILTGRAAIAYRGSGSDAPVFGVAWFKAAIDIDRENRTVHYETVEITDIRFPKENKGLGEEFKQAVRQGVKKGNLISSLDELTTALAAVDQEQKQAGDLKNDPPEIVYMDRPALLVVIDGKPMLRDIEKSGYQAVANTPYPLFFDKKSGGKWFLNAADNVWFTGSKIDGPWAYTENPPTVLVKMVVSKANENEHKVETSGSEINGENAPVIVVVFKPTELIVSTGKAEFVPLTDDLLVMSNTDSDVFMDVMKQKYYLMISGRWYTSSSMTGTWHFVAADTLPSTFADIPRESEYMDVRASVAGTDEAREAVMDAQIPQTAAVKKGVVDIKVVYDGKPQFKAIGGTGLQFALNCSETVIKTGKQFYLVKDAVWYVSGSATGPWTVSNHVPPEIDKIPPSSPVYNIKYVYVYDSTPEVVYVGYTPGYVGSYIYGPTIVYGTGYYYSPWITPHYYYPRPATWGMSVSYNPWTGWGFGLSWSSGPFRFGFYTGGGYHGRYWGGRHYYGPGGYRPSYRQVSISHNSININTRRNFNGVAHRNNIYRRDGQRAAIHTTVNSRPLSQADRQNIQKGRLSNPGGKVAAAGGGAALGAAARGNRSSLTTHDMRNKAARLNNQGPTNNVLADRNGNVLRNNNGQWQNRNNGQWQNKATPALPPKERSAPRQRSGYDRSSSMDRQQYSRQRATERTQHQGRSGNMSGGGGHRGGGRRR